MIASASPEIPAHLVALLKSQLDAREHQKGGRKAGRPRGRPQPLLEASARMQITYQELLDLGHEVMGIGEESYKSYRRELRDYMVQVGWGPGDVVPDTFPEELEHLLRHAPPVHPNPRQVKIKIARCQGTPRFPQLGDIQFPAGDSAHRLAA